MKDMFPFLNKGCSRKVYAINDDVVIKIARYLEESYASWGIEQCKTEMEVYNKYGSVMPLCKIFSEQSTDYRIVMERVTPLSELESTDVYEDINKLIRHIEYENEQDEPGFIDSLTPVLQRFAKKILESGLTRGEIRAILTDVEFSNIGIQKNGELVILDYGLFGEIY